MQIETKQNKKGWGSSTCLRQNRFQNRSHKRQRRLLHNTKEIDPTRGYNLLVNIHPFNIGAPKKKNS